MLKKEHHESYENAKISYICKENFENKYVKDKKYRKVTARYKWKYRDARIAYVILNIVYLQKFLWFFIMDKTMIISLS